MNIYDVYKNPVGKIYADATGIDVMSAIVTAVESGSKTPNYLCFTAEEAGSTISMIFHNVIDEEKPVLYISRDKENWETWNYEPITLTNVGDKVYMYGTNNGFGVDDESYCAFTMTGRIAASGNIQTLLSQDGSRKSVSEYCYYSLFEDCSSLTTAPELPATVLATDCYDYMFGDCTSLTTAPELPATELATECYSYMFSGCRSLTTAPELPATVLAENCYSSLFFNCTNLNSITVHATSWNEEYANNWVTEVSPTGTFTCPAESNIPTGSENGIPEGWTRVDL